MFVRYFLLLVLSTVLCNLSIYGKTTFLELENTQCGNIFTDKQVVLISENYPLPYSPKKECFYLLKGQNCTVKFNVEFLDFDIKTSVGCTKDRLEIGHQDALCGKVNGSKLYTAEKGSLKIKFISNDELEKNSRGFRVLVTRIDACDRDNSSAGNNITFENRDMFEITTESNQIEWTNKSTSLGPNYLPPVAKQCCQNSIFVSKRFFLVSPNFPYSSNMPEDCIYVIKKASSQVCRLRINVLFFSLGPPTETSCPYGYLEIDGKYICGCNSDLKLTTNFRDLNSIVIKYHNSGYSVNDFFGFVLEVIQDECPKRYSPDDGVFAERSLGKFRFYEDQHNRVSWPEKSNTDPLKLVNERIYWSPKAQDSNEREFGNVYKHFYFFAPEDEKDVSWIQNRQEKEETNYIEISTINTLLTSFYDYQQCVQWNGNQMILLNRRFGNSLDQMCKLFQQNTDDIANCQIFSSLQGNIKSPGYPLGYFSNQNVCYRFKIFPGYCAVKIHFNDFQIEESYDCLKDYLAINEYRYCGNYLTNKQATINIKGKSHQDLNFITDANYCGKGFSAMYQLVPCQKNDDPISPFDCNSSGGTTQIPLGCNKLIREQYFVVRKEPGMNFCSFKIRKFSENVCKIKLYFELFNLSCDSESILINGEFYCGQLAGQSLTVDILEEQTILYRSNSLQFGINYNSDFLIRGIQINDDCESNIPDPVRLTLRNSKVNDIFSTDRLDKKMYPNPDVCNIIKNNITSDELPKKICEILAKTQNVSDCKFLKAEFIDSPTNEKAITKIRLTSKESEELNYKIIECQN